MVLGELREDAREGRPPLVRLLPRGAQHGGERLVERRRAARERRPLVLERGEADGVHAAHLAEGRLEAQQVVADHRVRVDVALLVVHLVPEDLGRHVPVRARLRRHLLHLAVVLRRVPGGDLERARALERRLGDHGRVHRARHHRGGGRGGARGRRGGNVGGSVGHHGRLPPARARQPKVGDLEGAGEVEQQVGRLEVAVDDGRAARVQVDHPLRNLHQVVQRLLPREGGAPPGVVLVGRDVRAQQRLEVALHQLGDDDVVLGGRRPAQQHADVRVAQVHQQPSLLEQQPARELALLVVLELGRDHLARDVHPAPRPLDHHAEGAAADLAAERHVGHVDGEVLEQKLLARPAHLPPAPRAARRRRARLRPARAAVRLAQAVVGGVAASLDAARRAQRVSDVDHLVAQRVVERRAAPPILGVGVGARRQQVRHHRQPPLARRQVQRRARVVVAAVDREPLLLAHLDDLRQVANRRRLDQIGRRVARLHAAAHHAARVAQRLRALVVVLPQRVVQRRAAPPVARVGLSARGQQIRDHQQPPLARGQVERGALVVVAHVERQALVSLLRLLDQPPHRLQVALGGGIDQVLGGRVRALGAGLRPGGAQRLGRLVVVAMHRVVERPAAPTVLRVRVGARGEQVHDGGKPALTSCQVQWRPGVIVSDHDGHAVGLDEPLHRGQVSTSRAHDQLKGRGS